jgi:predicted phosphodiesterase
VGEPWGYDPRAPIDALVNLEDALRATEPVDDARRDRPQHPKGWEPGYEWNGSTGHISTGPVGERPKTWDEFIRDAGLNPDEVEVEEPVQVRGWDLASLEAVKNPDYDPEDPDSPEFLQKPIRAHYYRLTVRRRTAALVDIAELVKAVKRKSSQASRKAPPEIIDAAYLVALGDLQLGKMDGDGVEGTTERFLTKTTEAVARYKRIAKGSTVYLTHLGDCIEGFVSQGGANTWRTTLTVTEQVRLYRWLLMEQVKAFAAVAPKVVVVGVPGNHDEANRPLHTYGDSWAIEALSAVKDVFALAGNYEHVSFIAPARDELTVTLDVCGTIVGMAHGHQWRPGQHVNWWAKQAHGRQAVGDAHLLLAGHLHHLRIEQTGSDKTFLQVPALESGSQWWKHRTGEWGQPGIVTAVVGGGTWRSLEVL